MCVHYNLTSKTAAVMLDTDPATGGRGNIYYVDNDGDKHWTQAELPELEAALPKAVALAVYERFHGVEDK